MSRYRLNYCVTHSWDRFRKTANRAGAVLLVALGMSATGWAADGSWSSTGNGTWSNSGNWEGGTIADGSGYTAFFTNAVATDVTVTNDSGTRTIGNLQFGNPENNNSNNWTIVNNTLNLAGGDPNGYRPYKLGDDHLNPLRLIGSDQERTRHADADGAQQLYRNNHSPRGRTGPCRYDGRKPDDQRADGCADQRRIAVEYE